ncbi:MAG: protease complex subunit PrcB family protein [Balneolaceae bacterium]|nr:protease complex subunit PrcB family protein [Balneolaceae bacterium]
MPVKELEQTQCRSIDGPNAYAFSEFSDIAGHGLSDTIVQRVEASMQEDNILLLVSMGQQPTGGYSATLASEIMSYDPAKDAYVIDLNYRVPTGAATTALTYPCTLLALPTGRYDILVPSFEAGDRTESRVIDISSNPFQRITIEGR